MDLIDIEFESYDLSVAKALDAAGAAEVLAKQKSVLIKPNLVNASPFPITTAPDCVEAIVQYVRTNSNAEIVIGEGCGDHSMETDEVYEELGYCEMASRLGVNLIDLNHAPLRETTRDGCDVFPTMHLPEITFTHFLISVPVLKAHSIADVTGTLKNMIGIAPPKYYSGRHGSWKKSVMHGRMQESILDLNRHRTPDLTLMDASVGMPDFHLGGRHCDPPLRRMLAGFDPVAIDRRGAELLELNWRTIGHLQ
jgi:uncharacterized protein (DUF362 family)